MGKRLLAEGWDGTAARGYDGSWTDWKKGADTVLDVLDKSSVGLADAANGYEIQDAGVPPVHRACHEQFGSAGPVSV